ncbi:carboxylesterase family protein [Kitasatospora sp. NPDC097605]|uniref:carboxylesterase family protein n=1 Tax=Kitasatospora sp. NPDC097605 TaxID=3157226 RepID=UPI00331E9317
MVARAVYAGTRPRAGAADLFSAVMSDHGYRLPALRVAEARAAQGADTYVYEFTQPSPALDGALGACHMAEIGAVFGNPHDPLTDPSAHPRLSERVRGAWISFARHGRPAGDHLPPWPAYLPGRSVMFLDATAPAVHQDPARSERLLWDGLR